MCGICGVISVDANERIDPELILRMRETLVHRGPDDAGLYIGPGVGLGHRRLSIIDLRPEGRQPLGNEDNSIQLVFNGEIYNFQELREELIKRGHHLRSRTDTEVIAHLYEDFGIECLHKLRGMFAFGLWDARQRLLLLARDRLGKKPLFYSFDGRRLLFGSEPKAILAWPGLAIEPDLEALDLYLGLGYVPSPWSAFKGIRKLEPAHYLTFSQGKIEVHRYWRLKYLPKIRMSAAEATEEIRMRLAEAVRLRMVSDVPVGAFLSGGLDSSAVVAMMSRLASGPVKTFTIGFREPRYDERHYAGVVARHFGTEHHEFVFEPEHAAEILDRLVWHYNEPYADQAALPTYWLSKFAREHVTVALNGDAGDENFAGYRHHSLSLLAGWLHTTPRWAREPLANLADRISRLDAPPHTRRRLQTLGQLLRSDGRFSGALFLEQFSAQDRANLVSPEFARVADGTGVAQLLGAICRECEALDPVEARLVIDVNLFLPDDLLVKVDIASMAVGLEARSPMIDHEFMEFTARLPRHLKLTARARKVIFKKAMVGVVPQQILTRAKKTFAVPLDYWFRNSLREMTRDILLSSRSLERGYFERSSLTRLVEQHLNGIIDRQDQLWSLLMLELWHRKFIDNRAACEPAPTQRSVLTAPLGAERPLC
jgi:asparagine synthase (glutamine-hydrolysing)